MSTGHDDVTKVVQQELVDMRLGQEDGQVPSVRVEAKQLVAITNHLRAGTAPAIHPPQPAAVEDIFAQHGRDPGSDVAACHANLDLRHITHDECAHSQEPVDQAFANRG